MSIGDINWNEIANSEKQDDDITKRDINLSDFTTHSLNVAIENAQHIANISGKIQTIARSKLGTKMYYIREKEDALRYRKDYDLEHIPILYHISPM